MQTKDTGDWLSAQQAVQADGTELSNLPLINKKLPPLVPPQAQLPETSTYSLRLPQEPEVPPQAQLPETSTLEVNKPESA